MKTALQKKAIQAIQQHGALLTFSINNKKEPLSLWSTLYPRSDMKWEWNEDSDPRVAQLWHLREQLSTSREVIYSKWYQGRATFFSLEAFQHLLSAQKAFEKRSHLGSREAKEIIDLPHPCCITTSKVVVDSNDVHTFSFECIQIC